MNMRVDSLDSSFEKKSDELFAEGKSAFEAGQFQIAYTKLQQSIGYAPRTEAYLLQARASIAQDVKSEALRCVESGLRKCLEHETDERNQLLDLKETLTKEIASEYEARTRLWKQKYGKFEKEYRATVKSKTAKAFAKHFALPSVRLIECESDRGTHFGGATHLPADLEWPATNDGTPLEFLCEIDLDELASCKTIAGALPTIGMLAFFADQPTEKDPHTLRQDSCRVLYFADKKSLQPRQPAPEISRPVVHIRMLEELSYPDTESDEVRVLLDLDKGANFDYYNDLLEGYHPANTDTTYHRLLGHPQLLQNDPREECERLSQGGSSEISPGDLFTQSRNWKMLLQLEVTKEQWCRLFFMIQEDALKRLDFTNVLLCRQSPS